MADKIIDKVKRYSANAIQHVQTEGAIGKGMRNAADKKARRKIVGEKRAKQMEAQITSDAWHSGSPASDKRATRNTIKRVAEYKATKKKK